MKFYCEQSYLHVYVYFKLLFDRCVQCYFFLGLIQMDTVSLRTVWILELQNMSRWKTLMVRTGNNRSRPQILGQGQKNDLELVLMNKKNHLLLWFNLGVLFAVQTTHFFNIWALSWPYLQDIFSIKENMSECNMRVHMSSCSITLLTMIKIREHIS